MEREGGIHGLLLTAVLLVTAGVLSGGCCRKTIEPEEERVMVTIGFEKGSYRSRAEDPDEELISDVSLMIFDNDGDAAACCRRESYEDDVLRVSLTKGRKYTFCACINFGYPLSACRVEELAGIRYHMVYPDEYREGIPMYAFMPDVMIKDSGSVILEAVRLMSKISIRMDRNSLSEDVRMNVVSVRIGNCPKSVKVFGESRADSGEECFNVGFSRSEEECSVLNTNTSKGISGWLSLYMLENMQGDFSAGTTDGGDKVFEEDDPRFRTCSYVEIGLEYVSDTVCSIGKNLVYRFYFGEGPDNLDVERNCHYRITVIPEDDGLGKDGWSVDKSGLLPVDQR